MTRHNVWFLLRNKANIFLIFSSETEIISYNKQKKKKKKNNNKKQKQKHAQAVILFVYV